MTALLVSSHQISYHILLNELFWLIYKLQLCHRKMSISQTLQFTVLKFVKNFKVTMH
uniref:Uncharacterized protein n=1 Tax=Amphimedon queenslandica TaxID=400682 RepID=A0A1X7SYE9_AMPQE